MITETVSKATQNDKFRHSTLTNDQPGRTLYLRQEIKVLPHIQRDMIITKAHNFKFGDGDESNREHATFEFFGQMYFFDIEEDMFTKITIGMVL